MGRSLETGVGARPGLKNEGLERGTGGTKDDDEALMLQGACDDATARDSRGLTMQVDPRRCDTAECRAKIPQLPILAG